jgi:hypothetical protein
MAVAIAVLALLLAGLTGFCVALFVARDRLKDWAARQLLDVTGPTVVRSMPPREVLAVLLARLYGEGVGHDALSTGLLGGAGRDPQARDTAVSRLTDARFTLTGLDGNVVQAEYSWTHNFTGVRHNHLFVLFGTLNLEILRAVVTERVYPLFELWRLYNEEQLEDFVPELERSLKVGIVYRDSVGNVHSVAPTPQAGREVALRDFDKYVHLPDRLDRKELRIVELDLHDLADDDHVVSSVESLTITASNRVRRDLGYITWSPPHPCFVRSVSFDVEQLPTSGESYEYLLLTAMLKQGGVPLETDWVADPGRIEFEADSWMLPGHGVTLVWRLANRSQPAAYAERGGDQ